MSGENENAIFCCSQNERSFVTGIKVERLAGIIFVELSSIVKKTAGGYGAVRCTIPVDSFQFDDCPSNNPKSFIRFNQLRMNG